jgi:ABC-type branched-subunit amino acid transport system substrate-binding protein
MDALLLVAYPDDYKGIYKEIGVQGLHVQMLTTDTFYSPELLATIGEGANGTVCVVASKPGTDYEPRKRFIEAYKANFKDAQGNPKNPGLTSDTSYDALYMLASGIIATDGSPHAVANYLLQLKNYKGVAGLVTFTPTGDFLGGMDVFRVVKGVFQPYTKEPQ